MHRSGTGKRRSISFLLPACLILLLIAQAGAQTAPSSATPEQVPLVFSGGHETDPRDRGRPVILIAAALGVSSDVFREAFSHVHPAPAGTEPEPDQVRLNKAALLGALGPYGITDDLLNTVSNYYRYNRSRGEMWPTREAAGYATVANGAVTGVTLTQGGAGYSSPPMVKIPGFEPVTVVSQLSFGKSLEENGSVSGLTLAPAAN